jgi:hypothetical protein
VDAPVVIFDACVLYPAPLRDVLLELSTEGIFLARWTDDIHDEWISNLLENAGGRITPQTLDRTRQLMNKAVPDCLVTGYRPLIESLRLPDKDDRHVLAAAIVAKASVIITTNLRDFPKGALAPYRIDPQHPDDFLVAQLDRASVSVLGAVRRLRARLKKPRMSATQYLDILTRLPLPRFVERLRNVQDEI